MKIPTEDEIKTAKKLIEVLLYLIPAHCKSIRNFPSGMAGFYANIGPQREIKIFYSDEELKAEYFF